MSAVTKTQATAGLNLAGRLDHLFRTARIYPDGHAAISHTLRSVTDLLLAVRADEPRIEWSIVQDRVVIGNRVVRPSPGIRDAVRELGQLLVERGLGGLAVSGTPNPDEVMTLVRLLLGIEGDGGPGFAALEREFASAGIRTLEPLSPRTLMGTEDSGSEGDPAIAALRVYLRGMRAVQAMRTRGLSPAAMVEVDRVALGIVDLWASYPRRALTLAVPRQLLPYPLLHPVHTSILSVAIGFTLGMDDLILRQLAVAALVAEVGRPSVDEDEDDEAAQHAAERATPTASVRELLALSPLDSAQIRRLRVALEQHRHFDGSGHPTLLRNRPSHLFTSIVALAAEYDALRADRDWRDGESVRGALRTLQQSAGTRHDPLLISILQDLQGELEVADAGM